MSKITVAFPLSGGSMTMDLSAFRYCKAFLSSAQILERGFLAVFAALTTAHRELAAVVSERFPQSLKLDCPLGVGVAWRNNSKIQAFLHQTRLSESDISREDLLVTHVFHSYRSAACVALRHPWPLHRWTRPLVVPETSVVSKHDSERWEKYLLLDESGVQ